MEKACQIISPAADVYGVPDKTALRGKFETQLVFGEIFIVEEEKDGWCRGTCAHDEYAGHIESKHLSKNILPVTHVITGVRSHIYRDGTIKSPLIETLGFGSLISVTSKQDDFAQIDGGAWIFREHISSVGALDKDHAATAIKFIETPYYWGGRSGFGVDCSGLVQVSLARAGISVPRDTEMQTGRIGKPVTGDPQRGDIVFFPGHVGIMADDINIVHANAFHMKVTMEPLETVSRRSKGITAIRRLLP